VFSNNFLLCFVCLRPVSCVANVADFYCGIDDAYLFIQSSLTPVSIVGLAKLAYSFSLL
jgi:hypothetical protein